MAYNPVSGAAIQYVKSNGQVASGYYLKFYIANTTTPLSMATDSAGGTTLVKCKLNDKGYPISNENDNTTVFIPYLNQSYRWVLYVNEADADANTTANADVNIAEVAPLTEAGGIVTRVDSVEDIAGFVGSLDDQQISLKGWHPDSDVGGGTLYWDSAALKSTHNGGTIFSDTVPWTTTTADYLNAVGETDPSGSGCWVRIFTGAIISEDFGAVYDNVTDDYLSHQGTIDYAIANGANHNWSGGDSRITNELIIGGDATVQYRYKSSATGDGSIRPHGSYAGNGDCFVIHAKTIKNFFELPNVTGFTTGAGVRNLTTNTIDGYCHTITSCQDGLVFECQTGSDDTRKVLDANFKVHQIGVCDNGVVFKTDASDNTMQGCLVNINFINGCTNSVVWDGVIATTPAWDRNRIEIEAIDPIGAADFANFRILSALNSVPVPNWIIHLNSWVGGFTAADWATAQIIDGKFTDCDILCSLAENPENLGVNLGVGAFTLTGSGNQLNTRLRKTASDTLVTALIFEEDGGAGITLSQFNSGVPLCRDVFQLEVEFGVGVGSNSTRQIVFFHQYFDNDGMKFDIIQGSKQTGVSYYDSDITVGWVKPDTVTDGKYLFQVSNLSSGTIPIAGKLSFWLRAVQPN